MSRSSSYVFDDGLEAENDVHLLYHPYIQSTIPEIRSTQIAFYKCIAYIAAHVKERVEDLWWFTTMVELSCFTRAQLEVSNDDILSSSFFGSSTKFCLWGSGSIYPCRAPLLKIYRSIKYQLAATVLNFEGKYSSPTYPLSITIGSGTVMLCWDSRAVPRHGSLDIKYLKVFSVLANAPTHEPCAMNDTCRPTSQK